MKKILALLLAAMMLLTLAACGGNGDPTDPAGNNDPNPTDPPVADGAFSFTFSGVELTPGTVFNASALPEANSVTQVPSCANQGTDNVYNYGTLEITAYNDGTNEVIYSIYILDANTPTTEGLYIGDGLAQIEDLYGTGYTREGNQITFQKGKTQLVMILENDQILSIDFRWVQN